MKKSYILAIESSCDDTAAAVICDSQILSNVVANQLIHKEYGGVVPELASRAHQQNMIPVVQKALDIANIQQKDLTAIGFTRGPGLLGALLVGTSFAKSFSMALNIPLIEVNHLQAHILAHFISDANPVPPSFPFLCLTVSGGHTMLVIVRNFFEMEVVGKSLDDAAGEAFDKIGKIMNLDYPAGAIIDKLSKDANPKAYTFAKTKVQDFDYSFSGIKTSVLYFLKKEIQKNPNFVTENLNDLCASIQENIILSLLEKLEKAADYFQISEIAISGGVSANSGLRRHLKDRAKQKNWNIYLPKLEYTTDNAAMIAMVAQLKFEQKKFSNLDISATSKYQF